jgi:hypothetical protein
MPLASPGSCCPASGFRREAGFTTEAYGDSPKDRLVDPLLLLGALARFGAFSSSRPSSAAGLLLALISSSYELVASSSPAAAAADDGE